MTPVLAAAGGGVSLRHVSGCAYQRVPRMDGRLRWRVRTRLTLAKVVKCTGIPEAQAWLGAGSKPSTRDLLQRGEFR